MSDFSDRPFVAGSLVGLRAFGIDKLGRLVGPSFPKVFKPGENEAECLKGTEPSFGAMYATVMNGVRMTAPAWYYSPTFSFPTLTSPSTPRRPSYGTGSCPCGCGMQVEFTDGGDKPLHEAAVNAKPVPKPTHVLGGLNCSCGFYAYFDGRNDYKEPTRVSAIIEGFGVCTVGDRGFRASKARLVALIEPKAAIGPMMRDYLHRNYPDVPFYGKRAEAVAAHPLTPPGAAITPVDEDFWTREVPR